jgi:hypothetical protein
LNYELLLDDPLFVALLTKSLELKSTDLVKFCFLSRSIAIKAMEIVTTMETSSFKVNLICDLIFFFPELQNEIVLPDKWDSSNISSFGRLLLHGILNEPETHIISFTELLFSEQIELKPILKEFFGQYQDRHQIDLANTIIVHFVTTFESSILEKEPFVSSIRYLIKWLKKESIPTIVSNILDNIPSITQKQVETILFE